MLLTKQAQIAIQAIHDAIALGDQYNHVELVAPPTLSDCDFPDCVEDPLALVRVVCGEEYARRLEYEDCLEKIAEVGVGWCIVWWCFVSVYEVS
jgi:hypothetical protein